nr:MAG TPA: hypothetical protein [Caudoviricetes sp.]
MPIYDKRGIILLLFIPLQKALKSLEGIRICLIFAPR